VSPAKNTLRIVERAKTDMMFTFVVLLRVPSLAQSPRGWALKTISLIQPA